jgi:hypothetical protein
MVHRYSPSGYQPKLNPEKCAAAVYTGVDFRQCRRSAKYGKWCAQHHPAADRERTRSKTHRRFEDMSRHLRKYRYMKRGYLKALRTVSKKFEVIQGAQFEEWLKEQIQNWKKR